MRNDTPRRFDVIVTAGSSRSSRLVLRKNKVFLPLAGAPVITHVLSAVERARCTARIFVVGDRAGLEDVLSTPDNPFQGLRPITLIEQGQTLYDNVWQAFLHTLPDYMPGTEWHGHEHTEAQDKAVLVVAGDTPLTTPMEIDEFVDSCDLTRYDYFLGLTAEPTLRPFYPKGDQPGIRMAYFTIRDLQVRQNNLHLVKPLRFANRHYIQTVYDVRYQKEWRNILKICREVLRLRETSLRMTWAFFCLHLARHLVRRGWQHIPLFRPFFLELPMVASLMSQFLGTRSTTVMTHYGGSTIDVDNAEHYDAIGANFARWMSYQYALEKELKQRA